MSSDPKTATVAPMPTLLIVPEFSYSAPPPGQVDPTPLPSLTPVPPAAENALGDIIRSASAADVNAVARGPTAANRDESPDPDLKAFFGPPPPLENPPTAAAPPPAPPPPPPTADEAESSSDVPVHHIFAAIGCTPGNTPTGKRYNYEDQKLLRAQAESGFTEIAKLDDRLYALSSEVGDMGDWLKQRLTEGRELTPRQLKLLADLVSKLLSSRDDATLAELVRTSNKQTTNFSGAALAIEDLNKRLAAVENVSPTPSHVTRITQIEATAVSQAATIQTMMAQISALIAGSGYTPSAPVDDAVAMSLDAPSLMAAFQDFLNGNGKRPRDDADDGANKRQVLASGLAVPPAFSYTPAVATSAPPAASPTAPPAPPPAAPPPAPPTFAPAPHAPAPGPLHAIPDPAREVIFGPVTWYVAPDGKRNIARDVGNLIKRIVPTPTRVNFRVRRAPGNDQSYTIVVFETSAVAEWFVFEWMGKDRGMFAPVTAVSAIAPPPPNA
ncbi:hypothetical protein C8R43DRAFT_962316 [Mycena crocata]|nr:hypothetical protein C8R43DRAFT_962316 [Mycena crocata]